MALSYWLEVHLCWVVLGLLYFLFFRSTTFYRWNRWYLLGSSAFGLALPIWSQLNFEATTLMYVDGWLPEVLISIESGSSNIDLMAGVAFRENDGGWQSWITWIYIAGVLLFFLSFLWGLWQLFALSKSSGKVKMGRYVVFSATSVKSALSFFHWIYLPDGLESDEKQTILLHEQAHEKAGHSMDLVFSSLLQIICWFSPVPWLLRKELRLLHEFEADAAAWKILGKKAYGYLLLQHTLKQPAPILTNQFHFVHLQKRFAMLFRSPSASNLK